MAGVRRGTSAWLGAAALLGLFVTWEVAFRLTALDPALFPPPSRISPDVVPELEAICLQAMRLRPAERQGSAGALAQGLEAWLADIRHWRREELLRMGYDGAEYSRPELRWTQSSFVQPQMMIEDRYFYDPTVGRYTVDRYLDDLENRYGGIDSVLVWHTYPNIGIDNRNQYDLLRDMPGGAAGLKQMVADFHRRGVRVLAPRGRFLRRPGRPGVAHSIRHARHRDVSRAALARGRRAIAG